MIQNTRSRAKHTSERVV